MAGTLCEILQKVDAWSPRRGYRSSIRQVADSAQSVQRMGMKPVAHIKGGFKAWTAADYAFAEGQPEAGESMAAFTPDPALAARN